MISGRLRTKMDSNFECLPHWRNAGLESVADLGILYTMLKVYICRDKWLRMKKGWWKCSGISDPIIPTLSGIPNILPW